MSNQLLGLFNLQELLILETFLLKNNKCNESELIKSIFELTTRPKPDFYNPLDLFHGHFILFNGLHRLNHSNKKQYYIHIQLTRIQLILANQLNSNTSTSIEKNDNTLMNYYMDEQNFRETSTLKVQEMLESFTMKFQAYLKQHSINDKAPTNWDELDAQYQKSIHLEHREHITNNSEFKLISTQYKQLKKYQKK
ncbi:MAG: hypothetical protein HRU38_16790 [Saccharospirillaceae bacterium]|nr:hypothetical protein [Pseudomonadales bacterium]NRB80294.1 hypothetical protein [Saccharospirillaceae bacterium]